MTDHNPPARNAPARLSTNSANDTAWPKGFRKRLEQFAERTNATPPARPFEGEGDDRTFSAEFLAYCQEKGLSLDWVYFGDVMPLAMSSFHRAQTAVQGAEKRRHSIQDCEYDAIILAGVVQALDLLDHEGKRYENARAAVTTTALRMADNLADDLSNLADKERRHA